MFNLVLILLYLGGGYLLQRVSIPINNLPLKLNRFVIYVSLPSMILLQIPTLELSSQTLVPAFVSWGVMIISFILTLLVSKYMNFSKEITGSLLLMTVLGNSSFLGIPMVTNYLGDESLPYILIYDQVGTFLALATYGTVIAAYYSHNTKVNAQIIIFKVITFPPFVALIGALFLKGVIIPDTINTLLEIFSETIVPFALVAVGLQLKFLLPKEELKPLTISLFIKLIIAPILAIFLCYVFNWNDFIAKVSIMEAAMAPMISAAVLASMAGLAPRLSNAIVAYGILLSFISSWIFFKIVV